MNIKEISRNDVNPPFWNFLLLAVGLMGLSVGTWMLWSLYIERKKRVSTNDNQGGLGIASNE